MEARTSTAEERRAGDLATRELEEATGGQEDTEEATRGPGARMNGSPEMEASLEDGEMTGSEGAAPAGLEVEGTLTSTVARRRASTARMR